MKLVMTLLVRDEEDIVDATVRFHLDRGVDLVLVTDNLSLDRTRDLLAPYERVGAARVWSESNDEYRQWEWVSRMAQVAATTYGADWVLHCDADEFWWTDRSLHEVLAAVPTAYDVVRAPRHDFLPLDPTSDRPFQERMTVRDTDPRNILGRPLMAKCAHRARDDVIVAQGNHFVVNEGMAEMPAPLDALILHFPARTYAQLERKVVLGGRAYARNRDMPATVGNTWRTLNRAYLDGDLQAHFDSLVPDGPSLAAGLASGRYVVDTRLRDALAGRLSPLPDPQRGWPVGEVDVRVARAVSDLDAATGTAGGEAVSADLEQRLLTFLDDARDSLVVVAGEIAACGVLAAVAGARERGVDVRLLTDDPAPLMSWRLHEAARLAPRPAAALVLRDGAQLWRGPASLSHDGMHGPAARAAVVPATAAVIRGLEALWSVAEPARALRPLVAGAAR